MSSLFFRQRMNKCNISQMNHNFSAIFKIIYDENWCFISKNICIYWSDILNDNTASAVNSW